MAEQKVGIKLGVTGDKKVEGAFKKVGKSAEGFEKQAGSLSGSLKKLAGAFIGLLVIQKITQFMVGATKAAMIQERMEMRLVAGLTTLAGATATEIKELIKYSQALQEVTGYGDEMIISAQGILTTFMLNAEEIKRLTPLLLDMAAGVETASGQSVQLESIALAVGKAFTSGIGILSRYGVALTEAQKKTFLLADQEGKMNILIQALEDNYGGLAEMMGKTYAGQVKIAGAAMSDLKEKAGVPLLITTVKLIESFEILSIATGNAGEDMGTLARIAVNTGQVLMSLEWITSMIIIGWKGIGDSVITVAKAYKENSDEMIRLAKLRQQGIDTSKEFKKAEEKLNETLGDLWIRLGGYGEQVEEVTAKTADLLYELEQEMKAFTRSGNLTDTLIKKLGNLGAALRENEEEIAGLGEEAEAYAKKIKSSFEALSKTIVSQIRTQTEAIKDLERELSGLSEDTDEQLGVAEDRYKDNLKNMARMAQERINQIDEQIEDTRETMSRGWRGEVEDLEKEKEKQKNIIARIGGEIVDIQAEAKKDELTVTQEAHAKEIAEIREQAKKRELEMQKEILEKKVAVAKGVVAVKAPRFFEEAARAEVGLRPWEISPYQNIFNIVIEGDLTSEDALLKKLIEFINRAAELKQFAKE